MKNAAKGELSMNDVAVNSVDPGWIKTRSSLVSDPPVVAKNLIVFASGSSAREPDASFSYLVAGSTIRAMLG